MPKPGTETAVTFTEADIEAAKKLAAKEAHDAAIVEFAEAEKKKQQAAAAKAITDFCKTPVKDGGPLPAWLDGGLKEFMEGLAGEATIEFAEGDKQVKKSSLDWFTGFLKGLPATVNFKEHAKGDEDIPDAGDSVEIAKLATEFKEAEAKAGRTITVTQAVNHVMKGSGN